MGRIYGAMRLHNVRTPDELTTKHHVEIRKLADLGRLDSPHPFICMEPAHARIDGGEWLIDCDCGAGNAVEPGWPEARCFACGAVHTNVVMPDEDLRLNVEHVLAARRHTKNRWWSPGERLLDLAIENAARGVRF